MISELRGQVTREYDLKSVFLFNFTQFVDWPTNAFASPSTPIVIGILGRDPFDTALESVVRDETVKGRRIRVERYSRVQEAQNCHLLFISSSETRKLRQILQQVRDRPILTVSEIEDFTQEGGMIRMFTEKARVRLRINNDEARAARLLISTKLLRLAEVVTREEYQ